MTNKKKRIIHAPEFKALAGKAGVAAAARQLSLHESQIYGQRKAVGRASRRARYRKKGRHLLREEPKVDCY